jgi:phytanoyl-CoA hydroxylase
MLTEEQSVAYERDGFLLVEDLISPKEVAALRDRVREYTHGGRSQEGLQVQVEPRVQRGELAVEHPGDGIRKIDSLAQTDNLFRALAKDRRILGIITGLLGADVKLFRNSLMLKPPSVGSPKGWHQDSPYWPIEPMSLCSLWLPLDDATPENGCMAVVPGAHKAGPLSHVNVTDDFVVAPGALDESGARALPMGAGSGLFFHSLLPHYTAPNRTTQWRRALVLSYMSARSRYTGEGEGPEYLQIAGRSYEGCVR